MPALKTGVAVDIPMIETICNLQDDLYRLRWISYAYADLAERLQRGSGDGTGLGANASWPAFARWSAYTISEALRLDEVNPRLQDVLRWHALPERLARSLVEIQKRLRSLDDGAMPTVLALGNRLVFHEVGYTVARFLEWMETQTSRNDGEWEKYEFEVTPCEPTDFFRPSYKEWLRDGLSAYYEAWWTRDAKAKAEHVLRGNILIGAYEQWRVDSFFEVALDFNPGGLIERLHIENHNSIAEQLVGVRNAGTRRALRHQWAMFNWMADAYAAFLTRFVLTWDAPLYGEVPSAVRLGCDLPVRQIPMRHAQHLEELGDEAQRLFDVFDRSGGQLRGAGARNWRRFTDRMSFIVNLFRTQQENANLLEPPKPAERRLLELQITDAWLDRLRKIGDPDVAVLLEGPDGVQPDVHTCCEFIRSGEPQTLLLDNEDFQIDYPSWVVPEKIERGQQFFEKHAPEIAAALFCASLPKAYTAARGARVMLSTAELVSNAGRRIAETGRLLFTVLSPNPRGLRPGTPGHKAALSVRSFHASVRQLLEQQEPWRSEWNEKPINQEDLLGTLTTFTVIVIETLEKMGIDVDPKDRDAYLHTWLFVGLLLGIDYDGLRRLPLRNHVEPLTYFEMQLLRDAIFRRHAGASAAGQILTRALLAVQESALPAALKPLPPAAIRRYIGDDAADILEVPPAGPVRVMLGALGPFGSAASSYKQGRVMQPRLADMTKQMFRQWISENGARAAWPADDMARLLELTSRSAPDVDLLAEELFEEARPALQ